MPELDKDIDIYNNVLLLLFLPLWIYLHIVLDILCDKLKHSFLSRKKKAFFPREKNAIR